MLTPLGRKKAPGDLVDRLLECHERIRSFVNLAQVAGERLDAPADEVVQACARVERYFTEALPLHVLDEEETILPRLLDTSPEVSAALQTMHEQHESHGPLLDAMLKASSAVRMDPEATSLRAPLASSARALSEAFEPHLVLEETVIFPVVRALDASVQARMLEELVGRRTPSA